MKKTDVAFVVDSNYALGCKVTIYSLLKKSPRPYNIHVVLDKEETFKVFGNFFDIIEQT